jgi:hypothetical protein
MTMAKKKTKTITLNFLSYRCSGEAVINHWGGGQGVVEMDSWDCDTLNKEDIVKGINDGRFGCESIDSATVYVCEHYDKGFTELTPVEVFEFEHKELTNATRGI